MTDSNQPGPSLLDYVTGIAGAAGGVLGALNQPKHQPPPAASAGQGAGRPNNQLQKMLPWIIGGVVLLIVAALALGRSR